MEPIRRYVVRGLFVSLAISLGATPAAAQRPRHSHSKAVPSGAATPAAPATLPAQHPHRSRAKAAPSGGAGLVPAAGGQMVYDRLQNVTWLANANLAATQTFGVAGVNRSGSMDYATAVRWVAAMNAYNHGTGYLGHNNWTLPTTPAADNTCSSHHVNSFGFNCSNSALGSLYYRELGLREPNTAVPIPHTRAGPFSNFQPYLYWSASSNSTHPQNTNGYASFSFNSGFQGANVSQNHLYVLPMLQGRLPGTPAAVGNGLQVNPGGQTIYDPVANVTWLADANLAATKTFGVTDINADGSMQHTTAVQWVNAMNAAGYLGQKHWELPPTRVPDQKCSVKRASGYDCTGSPLGELFYDQMKLRPGESVVATPDTPVGPFHDIQPYLYWACEGATSQGPCQTTGPAPGFEWSFSYGDGFEGTDILANDLYVMVYFPGPPSGAPAPPSPKGPGPRCKGTACK